ncbi:hypothetical protein GCM10022243_38740 [Saccharothrix violaceirubra]|uniref:Septal ring factor EnvC (AmiA/AmiB activator) n=1 Tax=Saccharothrix violaceirubra TaxID=413306 RepID=A0A7W7T0J3_9PSEU|nr:hypothetical protein [Saccharothrix violaceirubra]MBB4964341.1 septal ring factor EnvC (AmiA/AmiB activator) [Saccharothrix violaceirubra]
MTENAYPGLPPQGVPPQQGGFYTGPQQVQQPGVVPPPQQPAKGRTAVILLSVGIVLLLGASVLMAVLYFGANKDAEAEARRLDEVTTSLTEAKDKLQDTKKSSDEIANRITTLEGQNTELHKCGDVGKEVIRAARAGSDAELDAALKKVRTNC